MTRTRKSTGHISFVGAGPGDPGLLTRRALDALAGADQVVFDRGVPDALLAAVRADARPDAQFSPAEGASGDVAKVLLSAARSGLHAAHLVAGDPFGHESVVREVQAVARTAVPFEVVPGIGQAAGVATYAGVPLTGVRAAADVADLSTVDFPALVAAVAHGSAALSVPAGELAGVRDGLLAAGLDPATPVGVTGDGTGETQHTSTSTVDSMVSAALGFTGRVVLSLGPAVATRDKLSWWENRPLYGWKVLVPRTKEQAGAMSERLRGYGAIPCEVPTIAVEPPRTPAQMERAIKGLVDGRYAWVVFTSVNAVRAVWEKFAEHGLDARHFGGVKIACIGEATAAAVRDFGIQPELVPAGEQSSEGGTGRPAAGRDPRRDQVRRVRRGPLHVLVDSPQPGRDRRQAAHPHRRRGHRPQDSRHGGGVRPAGRRATRARLGTGPGGGARLVRRRTAREARHDAGEAAPRLQSSGPDSPALPFLIAISRQNPQSDCGFCRELVISPGWSNSPSLTRPMNAAHSVRVNTSTAPSGSFESRSATTPARLSATSTQLLPPPLPLRALLRHRARDRSIMVRTPQQPP